jgi:hypothetical protein
LKDAKKEAKQKIELERKLRKPSPIADIVNICSWFRFMDFPDVGRAFHLKGWCAHLRTEIINQTGRIGYEHRPTAGDCQRLVQSDRK